MELRGTRPSGLVKSSDLVQLTRLDGPVLSIYLNTDATADNASARVEQRWKTARRALRESGAPEDVLAAVDPIVGDAHNRGACLAVIADASGPKHVEHGDCTVPVDRAVWGEIAHLVPLIEWRQSRIPHVVVTADRSGADLVAVSADQDVERRAAGGVVDALHKPNTGGPGGWSQRRYQQRAENTWEQNAHDVAREIVALVQRTDARAVLAGGDVRAMQMIRDALPNEVRDLLVDIPVTRAADGSASRLDATVAAALDTIAGHDTTEILQKYAEELGQNDRAVDGVDETVGALQRAQVDALLVMERAVPDRTAWFGRDATQIATKVNALETFSVEDAREAPLVDVLVRAALGTDAGVRVVANSSLLSEGVGALLRWR